MGRLSVLGRRVSLLVLIGLVCVFAVQQAAEAKKRTIRYLPQEYSMDTLQKPYAPALVLSAQSCDADMERDRGICVKLGAARAECGDCCFINNDYRKENNTRCTRADPAISGSEACPASAPDISPFDATLTGEACNKITRHVDSCLAGTDLDEAISVYARSCPGSQSPSSGSCTWDKETHSWFCDRSDYDVEPVCAWKDPVTGEVIEDTIAVNKEEVTDSGKISRFCRWTGKCFEYKPKDPEQVSRCSELAGAWFRCQNQKVCCAQQVCGNRGMQNACVKCEERVELENLYNQQRYSVASCTSLINDYNTKLLSGRFKQCFRPVDSAFRYAFVAKSNELVTFIWMANCKALNSAAAAAGDNFYSMLKIYDVTGQAPQSYAFNENDVVYSSIAHTKAFAADFSLNAAATFNQGRSGRVYLATVCYFIPVTSKNLQMSVSFQQLIIQRNRQ